MRPAVAIDPSILAVSAESRGEQQIADLLDVLSQICAELRRGSKAEFLLLADTAEYLAKGGFFPSSQSIAKMLSDYDLHHVYAAEDIRRFVNDILIRARTLEEVSPVKFMVPTSVVCEPDILRIPALLEAQWLTLLHLAFVSLNRRVPYAGIVLAGTRQRNEVAIKADVECISPPFDGKETLDQFSAKIESICSLDDFLNRIDPIKLWACAENTDELEFAISVGACKLRAESGCKKPLENCDKFVIGPMFWETLVRWNATLDGKNSSLVFEACARLVARLPKGDMNRFFRANSAKNSIEDVVRDADRAEAWRLHLTKEHEALRLMFWRCSTGSIEFANVGPKAELQIF